MGDRDLRIRRITSEGVVVVQLRCPGCNQWGTIDDDQYHGRVSVEHPECGYHDTQDWSR